MHASSHETPSEYWFMLSHFLDKLSYLQRVIFWAGRKLFKQALALTYYKEKTLQLPYSLHFPSRSFCPIRNIKGCYSLILSRPNQNGSRLFLYPFGVLTASCLWTLTLWWSNYSHYIPVAPHQSQTLSAASSKWLPPTSLFSHWKHISSNLEVELED